MENGKWKMTTRKQEKKREKKRGKNNQIFGSIIQSSQPSVVLQLHNLCKPRLLTSYPHFFSCCVFILGIVTGIASRKALLFPSYKSSYFLSFGTDLLRDFNTFLLYVYLTGKCGVSRC